MLHWFEILRMLFLYTIITWNRSKFWSFSSLLLTPKVRSKPNTPFIAKLWKMFYKVNASMNPRARLWRKLIRYKKNFLHLDYVNWFLKVVAIMSLGELFIRVIVQMPNERIQGCNLLRCNRGWWWWRWATVLSFELTYFCGLI